MNRFTGRVALVTGASRGIGLAVASRLVAEGASVCVTARGAEPLARAVAEFASSGRVLAVAGNAADPAHQDEVVTRVLDEFGRLDVVVNNSAVNPVYGPVLELDDDAVRKVFEVNLLAPIGLVRRAHKAWLGANGGCVVNIAALAGLRPIRGIGAYGVSKAALIRLTEQLAIELSPSVRVNAVAPAVVRTRFAAKLYEGKEAEVAGGYPLRRLGEPDDIAGAVAYLASDDASWITGQTVVVDGGLTLSEPA
ncbi:SDR family oxidoreductase [Kutzneria sp. NPDC052558]|uniref:SDR family oxidoreductase n=1 Tax=Kutzneria sp. NPDC052558 TaxID=3364121 RepID=UPI0037C93F94